MAANNSNSFIESQMNQTILQQVSIMDDASISEFDQKIKIHKSSFDSKMPAPNVVSNQNDVLLLSNRICSSSNPEVVQQVRALENQNKLFMYEID